MNIIFFMLLLTNAKVWLFGIPIGITSSGTGLKICAIPEKSGLLIKDVSN